MITYQLPWAALAVAMPVATVALTSEGLAQGSNYFPGSYAEFEAAIPPDPGLLFENQVLVFSGRADRHVLAGRVHTDLDVLKVSNLFSGSYTFNQPLLGAIWSVGAWLPVGYNSARATVGPVADPGSVEASQFGLGDMGLTPVDMYWQFGQLYLNLFEVIYVPTGRYDPNSSVNIGLNVWSFDSIVAFTWLSKHGTTQLALVNGITVNTKNAATDYREGTEYHADFMLDQSITAAWAVGLRGYYYNQFTPDSGSGAVLGAFQGEAYGLGPALNWTMNPDMTLSVIWVHDVESRDRFGGDWVTLTFGWEL